MNFSPEWEALYAANRHMSVWPWSDVVSLVMRHARPTSGRFSVLELGCGAGANVVFFKALGVKYTGIDGSETTIAKLKQRFPDIAGDFVAGDFTKSLPDGGPWDLILDRSSLTHNATGAIQKALGMIWESLSRGGTFIGVDWFSTEYSEYPRGAEGEDRFTRTGYVDGGLADTGIVHFADRAHLEELFAAFEIYALYHRVDEQILPSGGARYAAWNIVARPRVSAPAGT